MALDLQGATRAQIDEILKEWYEGPIREQLNNETLLHGRLHRNTDVVDGRRVLIPVHIGRNRGIGAAFEGGLLPSAGTQVYDDMSFWVKYNYGAIRVSGPAMASSRTNEGAFIRVLESEMRGMVRDFKQDLNRQEWGDGSGRVGVVNAGRTVPGSGVIGVQGVWDSGDQMAKMKHFYVGDRIAVYDISAGAPVALTASGFYATVTAVDYDNKTITINNGAAIVPTLADGDAIFRGPNDTIAPALDDSNLRGSTGATPQEAKEMMGLVGIVNGPNGFPLDGASGYTPSYDVAGTPAGDLWAGTNGGTPVRAELQNFFDPIWRANVYFNSGVPRPLTTDLMQRAFDASEEIGQATPSIGLTSYAVRRRYVDLLVPDRRYVGANTYELDGGHKAVDFNGCPIVVEKDCPEGSMFFLSEANLMIALASDFYWLDKDGAILKWVADRDAWEARMAYYAELATDRRNAHSVIGDIKVS